MIRGIDLDCWGFHRIPFNAPHLGEQSWLVRGCVLCQVVEETVCLFQQPSYSSPRSQPSTRNLPWQVVSGRKSEDG